MGEKATEKENAKEKIRKENDTHSLILLCDEYVCAYVFLSLEMSYGKNTVISISHTQLSASVCWRNLID